MVMDNLMELAERVEALHGASRGTNEAVACAAGWKFDNGPGAWITPGGEMVFSVPNFTGSLDAAMSLLTGYATLISLSEIGADGMPLARVGRPDLDDVPIFEGGAFGVRMDTPLTAQLAIALTAACLKARAHSLPSADEAGR